jgi:probable F420-dependent oxidoreductase
VKRPLGTIGASVGLDDLTDESARELEHAGYGALWVGPNVNPDLAQVEQVLAATESVSVITAITSIWAAEPAVLAASYKRVADRFGDRFILGLGTAHAGINAPTNVKPLQAMKNMLDRLDTEGVPADGRLLAALGPRMTQLAGKRSLGAHPYLAPAATTPHARELLGPDALLAQAILVVITDDDDELLRVGREAIKIYLTLDNYRRNFLRAGFAESDLDNGGSERLVHALVASGSGARAAVDAHLTAGADHVSIGVRLSPGQDTRGAYLYAAQMLELS